MQRNLKNLKKEYKIFLFVIAGIMALAIIFTIANSISHIGRIKTIVKYAPYNATIKLNGTNVSNNTTLWLEEGNYTLEVSCEHFNTITQEITINPDNGYILGYLEAADDAGRNTMKQHNLEFIEVEGLIGEAANKQGEKKKQQYPILRHLPLNYSLYSINYSYDENEVPIITIKSAPEYLDAAVAKLKTFKDVDIEGLNLQFNTTNNFTDPQENPIQDPIRFIRAAYQLSDKYIIKEGKTDGDYYYTSAYIRDYDHDLTYGTFRIILKKDGNNWKIVAAPQPLFTTNNTKDIDKNLLKTINSY